MTTSQSSKGSACYSPTICDKMLLVWNISKHVYVGTCSVVSLVFFCPDHYGRPPKSKLLIRGKIWGWMKYENVLFDEDVWNWLIPVSGSIPSLWLQSNVVFAVKDQNPAHIFHRLSVDLRKLKTPNILQLISRSNEKEKEVKIRIAAYF